MGHQLLPSGAIGLSALPFVVGIAVALRRHRLFDIERLANRSLVYVSLVAILVAGYAALVAVLVSGLVYFVFAIALNGLSTGMYMGAQLGNGPRDGMILGISVSGGWPFRRVRTVVEMFVLAAGYLMGGAIGIGTILFAVSIGPASQLGLQLFGVLPRAPRTRIPVEAPSV